MSKKFAFITILFFILILAFGGSLLQKAGLTSEGTSSLSGIKLCTFVPNSGECRDDRNSFNTDSGDIFATVKASNIDASVVSVKWVYILDGVESIIAQADEELFSDDTVQFQLEKSPTRGWLEGSYRIEIELKEQLGSKVEKEFTITAQ